MENILDSENTSNTPKTNYKKWAFRFFIYAVVTNLVIAYKVANFISMFDDADAFRALVTNLTILERVCLLIGVIFIILSFRNDEEKDYQYKISVWGFSILVILTTIANLA